jgi:hypothetical protein
MTSGAVSTMTRGFSNHKAAGSGHARREEATVTITDRRDAAECRESPIGDVEFEER